MVQKACWRSTGDQADNSKHASCVDSIFDSMFLYFISKSMVVKGIGSLIKSQKKVLYNREAAQSFYYSLCCNWKNVLIFPEKRWP